MEAKCKRIISANIAGGRWVAHRPNRIALKILSVLSIFVFDDNGKQMSNIDVVPYVPRPKWAMRGVRIGQAKNPGPMLNINVINATHAWNNRGLLAELKGDLTFGQEHSTARKDHKKVRDALRGPEIHLSNVDPEACDKNVGGLFLINNTANKIICPKPINETLLEINGEGRIQLYGMTLGPQTTVLVYDVYFHTGADTDKEAMERTNDMLKIMKDDIKRQPKGPVLILGDFNCTITRIAEIHDDLDAKDLIDVGSQADKFGNKKDDTTCLAHGAKRPTRKDYVLANPDAFNMITNFTVDHERGFDVQSVLKFSMKCNNDFEQVQGKKTVKSFVEAKIQLLKNKFLQCNRGKKGDS